MIVYDDNTLSCTRVLEWIHGFKDEPLGVHVDSRFKQPYIMTHRTIIKIIEDCRIRTHKKGDFISRSTSTMHQILYLMEGFPE